MVDEEINVTVCLENPAVYNEQGCKFENMYYTRYPETSYNGGA